MLDVDTPLNVASHLVSSLLAILHLLNTKPRLRVLDLLNGLGALVPGVGGDGGAEALGRVNVKEVRGAHDEDVGGAAEGVVGEGAGLEEDLGILARSLSGGGSIVVPHREILNGLGSLVPRPGLATGLKTSAEPDVLGLDLWRVD